MAIDVKGRVAALAGFLGLTLLVQWPLGCTANNNNKGSSGGTSQKGEVCESSGDCASGLACVPNANGGAGICEIGQFNIPANPKSCSIVQCSVDADCCLTPNCNTSRIACNNGSCTAKCSSDTDCGPGAPRCNGNGACVECMGDSDCPSGDTCDGNNVCQPPCQSDGDCPGFGRCNNGACVPGQCQTDLECVAATRHVSAKCGNGMLNGGCVVPCQTDLECGTPDDYNFYSCFGGTCTFIGCQSDKDCELYGTAGLGDAGGGGIGHHSHYVCQ